MTADGNVAPRGDIDNDVNAADYLVMMRFVLGLETPDGLETARGDLDGSGVLWAVVDSGSDLDHPDLRFVGGRSYPGCESERAGEDPARIGHGTAVAGIIAGTAATGRIALVK